MNRSGFTLVELVIAVGLAAIIFTGAYAAYSSILDTVVNSELRTEAANVINRQIEIMRNLPYEDIGIVGGTPSGVIPEEQMILSGRINFLINTYIRNVDDIFDGTSASDTAPADYKLIEVLTSCPSCKHFVPLAFTTTIAPKNLESATNNGSLFVNVFNGNGEPIQGASIHVVNQSVSPPINFTDTTNNIGQLRIIDTPTSTQSYHITVTKQIYSSDQTYPPGAAQNPNPVKPDATVVAKTLTTISFAIDKVSQINVKTSNNLCAPAPNQKFSIAGSKLIGTNPNIFKFSTSSVTDSNGLFNFSNIEWDAYNFSLLSTSSDLLGTIPSLPLIVNPNTVSDFQFVVTPAAPDSLLVYIKDVVSSTPINGASVTLSSGGYSKILTSGHAFTNDSDWSGGNYSSESSGMDADSTSGEISLLASASSTYPTSTEWLISNTIDTNSTGASFYSISWLPTTQPSETGNSVKFQIAANNDGTTWNFTGPGNDSNAYYTSSTSDISGLYNDNRYFRYKIFLSTADQNYTPTVTSVKIEFKSVCVPPGEVLFNNLQSGAYNISVSASGYDLATSTASVTSNYQQKNILLLPSE